MTGRTPKRSAPPASRPTRPTRRGVAIQPEEPEPYFSSRPTRREVTAPELVPPRKEKVTAIRGQFSIAAVKNVGANTVSGEIETIGGAGARKRPATRSQPPALEAVRVVGVTKKAITLAIHGKEVTLDRHAAIELASIIFTTFGSSTT